MKAAVYGPQGLEIRELAKPTVKPGQMLVRVRYVGLNRRELTRMKGDEGKVPGLEFAGEVAEVGAELKGFKAGDPVMAGAVRPTPSTCRPIQARRCRCRAAFLWSRRARCRWP